MQCLKNATPCRTAESHGLGATLVFPCWRGSTGEGTAYPSTQHQNGSCGCSGGRWTASIGPGWPSNRYARIQYRRTSSKVLEPRPRQASPSRSFLALLPCLPPGPQLAVRWWSCVWTRLTSECGRQKARLLSCLQHALGRQTESTATQSHLHLHIHSSRVASQPSSPRPLQLGTNESETVPTTHHPLAVPTRCLLHLVEPWPLFPQRFETNRSTAHLAVIVQLSGDRYLPPPGPWRHASLNGGPESTAPPVYRTPLPGEYLVARHPRRICPVTEHSLHFLVCVVSIDIPPFPAALLLGGNDNDTN